MSEEIVRCFVYRHFSACGQLLYVGISDRPGSRMAQHQEKSPWWSQVRRVDLEAFASREAALLAEEIGRAHV